MSEDIVVGVLTHFASVHRACPEGGPVSEGRPNRWGGGCRVPVSSSFQALSVDVPNSSYRLPERLEWALYTVSVDVPNSPHGFCGLP